MTYNVHSGSLNSAIPYSACYGNTVHIINGKVLFPMKFHELEFGYFP